MKLLAFSIMAEINSTPTYNILHSNIDEQNNNAEVVPIVGETNEEHEVIEDDDFDDEG